MLYILSMVFFVAVLATALTIIAGMLYGEREAIGRALGLERPSLLPPLPATLHPVPVRVVRRIQMSALRLAA